MLSQAAKHYDATMTRIRVEKHASRRQKCHGRARFACIAIVMEKSKPPGCWEAHIKSRLR